MALTHIVDTSVLKRLHRPAVRMVIEPLVRRGSLGRPRICDLEVGFSARNAGEWDDLIDALDVFTPIDTTARHVARALHVQRHSGHIDVRWRSRLGTGERDRHHREARRSLGHSRTTGAPRPVGA